VSAIVTVVITAVVVRAQGSRQTSRDGGGNVTDTATAAYVVVMLGLQYTATQHDGVNRLYNGGGNATFLVAGLRLGAEGTAVRAGSEYADVAVAAEQNNILLQHGDAVKFLRTAAAGACLKDEFDVEANVNGEKTAVELYGVNANVGPCNAGVLYAYLRGVLDDLLTQISQENAHVFVAIPIPTGIENAVGFHANRLACRIFARADTAA
jgi:hypothetical protein